MIYLKIVALSVFENFIQPSIEILNIRIDEPITTFTDLVMAAICFYAFYQILRLEYHGKVTWYFKYYFLTLGLGAMFGGIFGHAFLYKLAEEWKLISWILTLGSVALLAHALLEVAKPLVRPGIIRIISRFNILFFIAALIFTMWTMGFSPVKYYPIFGMLGIAGSLSYIIFHKTGNRGVLVLMGALGIGILSTLIFSFQWGLSPWFNHNDISHLILSYGAYTLYKGAALILT